MRASLEALHQFAELHEIEAGDGENRVERFSAWPMQASVFLALAWVEGRAVQTRLDSEAGTRQALSLGYLVESGPYGFVLTLHAAPLEWVADAGGSRPASAFVTAAGEELALDETGGVGRRWKWV